MCNSSDPFGLCKGPSDLKCTDEGKGPGVLGTMLAGVGQAVQNWWDAHKEGVKMAVGMLLTEGAGEWEGLTPATLRGKSMQDVEEMIPKSWPREESSGGGGTRYVHPSNRGEQIRVQPGRPSSSDPVKQGPYCRISRCGNVTDPIPLKGNPTLPPGTP